MVRRALFSVGLVLLTACTAFAQRNIGDLLTTQRVGWPDAQLERLAADKIGIEGRAIDTLTQSYNTVAEMVADPDLEVGQLAMTAGYTSKGDGGGNLYEIVAAATGTVDGGSYIDLTGSSLQANGLFPERDIRVSQFGASESGDASSKIQAAIDYAESLAGTVGEHVTVFGGPGIVYTCNSGITLDASLVSLDGRGCTFDFSALTSGSAVTIAGSTNPPRSQIINGMRQCVVKGPGSMDETARNNATSYAYTGNSVTGIQVGGSGNQGSRYTFDKMHVRNFEIAWDLGENAYLNRWFACQAYECQFAFHNSDETNSGENFSLFGCLVGDCDIAFNSQGSDTQFFAAGTSVDNCRIVAYAAGGSRIMFTGCHFEQPGTGPWTQGISVANEASGGNDTVSAPFYRPSNAQSLISVEHSSVVYSQPVEMPDYFAYDAVSDARDARGMRFLNNTFTEQFLPANGLFGSAGAYMKCEGNAGVQSGSPTWVLGGSAVGKLTDGGFEPASLPAWMSVTQDSGAISDRYTAANLSLTRVTSDANSGSASMSAQKSSAGSGTTAKFLLYVPIRQHKSVHTGHFYWKQSAGNNAFAQWSFFELDLDGDKIATIKNRVDMNSATLNGTDWMEEQFLAGSAAPLWATHFGVEINVVNQAVAPAAMLFDDVQFHEF